MAIQSYPYGYVPTEDDKRRWGMKSWDDTVKTLLRWFEELSEDDQREVMRMASLFPCGKKES